MFSYFMFGFDCHIFIFNMYHNVNKYYICGVNIINNEFPHPNMKNPEMLLNIYFSI